MNFWASGQKENGAKQQTVKLFTHQSDVLHTSPSVPTLSPSHPAGLCRSGGSGTTGRGGVTPSRATAAPPSPELRLPRGEQSGGRTKREEGARGARGHRRCRCRWCSPRPGGRRRCARPAPPPASRGGAAAEGPREQEQEREQQPEEAAGAAPAAGPVRRRSRGWRGRPEERAGRRRRLRAGGAASAASRLGASALPVRAPRWAGLRARGSVPRGREGRRRGREGRRRAGPRR